MTVCLPPFGRCGIIRYVIYVSVSDIAPEMYKLCSKFSSAVGCCAKLEISPEIRMHSTYKFVVSSGSVKQ